MASDVHADGNFDAIVVGGGLAGVSAARDLGDQGLSVLLLEAHDYLGGRTQYRKFADTDEMIEMGGTWLRDMRYLSEEIARYSLPTDPGLPSKTTFSVLCGQHRPGLTPPAEHWPALEQVAFRHLQAAERIQRGVPYDLQPLADLDIAWSDFLAPFDLSEELIEYLSYVMAIKLGRYPEEASTLALLSYVKAYGNMMSMYTHGATKFRGGTKAFIDAMVDDSGAEVRLESPVQSVAQDGTGVTVTTESGDEFTSRAAVIATPINLWKDIEFTPEISVHKREASTEMHNTPRTAKFWAQVRNAPEDPLVIAGPQSGAGALYLQVERHMGDDILCYGHVMGPETDVSTREGMERALAVFLPEAELVRFDVQDMRKDKYLQGAFAGFKPGRLSKSHSHLAAPEGRVSFATADISFSSMVFFDGALEMGRRAAAQATGVVLADRMPAA